MKRALTDPLSFSGIHNPSSDEILHGARLSPVKLTSRLAAEETARLFAATRDVLAEWLERLRGKARGGFPEKVTAFNDQMAVHGRYGKPRPVCNTRVVQRICYADNETNYCSRCQTEDWPKSIDELEQLRP